MANIFISYKRENKTIAKQLIDDIKIADHTVWFDEEISGGQIWWDKILEQIRNCDCLILVLTPKILESKACKSEYEYALALNKPILPVWVEGEISTNLLPEKIALTHIIDYRERDPATAIRLTASIGNIRPSKLPFMWWMFIPSPETPISHLNRISDQIEIENLSLDRQQEIFLKLKKELDNPENIDDTLELLEKLKNRKDIIFDIANQISDLLAKKRRRKIFQHQQLFWIISISCLSLISLTYIIYDWINSERIKPDIFFDQQTQLSWTRSYLGNPLIWQDANKYCKNLIIREYDNWGLPKIDELTQLYDAETANIKNPFEINGYWVWSSTRINKRSVKGFKYNVGKSYRSDINSGDKGDVLCIHK